jgi:hypothetical protein
MGLYFLNNTTELLWIAYASHSPGCEGGVDWAKRGWYGVAPGATTKVHSGYVGGSKFFYFAEADDLSPVWAGPFFTHLPWNSFDWCWTTASTSGRTLGLRKLEIPWHILDYTLSLV